MTNHAIAAAVPGRDPAAERRAQLRIAAADERRHRNSGDHGACCCAHRARLVAQIQAARAAGLSYRQIARELGCAPITVHRIEKGENR